MSQIIPQETGEQKLFSVSTRKLVILSISTLGLYELFWQYKNWKAIKQMDSLNISPFWRAFFSIFYVHKLFSELNRRAIGKGMTNAPSVDWTASAYIILVLAGNVSNRLDQVAPQLALLSNILWFVSFLAFIPFLTIQRAIDYYNIQIDPSYRPINKFYAWDIILAIVGSILILLIVIGILFGS